MAHQCAAISHTWCKKAVAESNSVTADVSVPNLRSKALTHHQVFWLMQPGADRKIKSTPRAASCLLMGSRPQWPPFGAKPRSCKYSYGVSPGLSPGSFYPREERANDDAMYEVNTNFIAHLQDLVNQFSCAQPQNMPRQPGPPPKLPRRGHFTPGCVTLPQ